jgi:DNA polymerase-4
MEHVHDNHKSTSVSQKSILHMDGDAFFASCEQAADPRLKGKPVITGYERGMAVAVSYEAKALGIKRGDPVFKIRKEHPSCIVMPSHYELYQRFSERMVEVVRRYTPSVEEYSIDECFADLSDVYQGLHMSPKETAQHIKREIESELGMAFSVGVGPTKVLAKIASTKNKPSGFIYMSRSNHMQILQEVSIGDVWGIGKQTSIKLQTYGIQTAFDLIQKDVQWVERHFSKPFVVIWHELRGRSLMSLETHKKETFDSISKTHTFTPPSSNPTYVFAQLSRNIEGACRKARHYRLAASKATVFIKTQQFTFQKAEIVLADKSFNPSPFIIEARRQFLRMWQRGVLYRATGITLLGLSPHDVQMSLFEQNILEANMDRVLETIDVLSKKYGSHAVYISSSMEAMGRHAPRRVDTAHPDTLLIPVISDVLRRRYVPLCGVV